MRVSLDVLRRRCAPALNAAAFTAKPNATEDRRTLLRSVLAAGCGGIEGGRAWLEDQTRECQVFAKGKNTKQQPCTCACTTIAGTCMSSLPPCYHTYTYILICPLHSSLLMQAYVAALQKGWGETMHVATCTAVPSPTAIGSSNASAARCSATQLRAHPPSPPPSLSSSCPHPVPDSGPMALLASSALPPAPGCTCPPDDIRAYSGLGGERTRPRRCLRQQLGHCTLLVLMLRGRRITRFQAEWCRDGRERGEKLRQRGGAGKGRYDPSVRGFRTTGSSNPASESCFERNLTSRLLTHVRRSTGSRRTAAPGQHET